MHSKRVKPVIAFVLLLLQVASAQTRPAVELEGAIAKEQVSGDLKAAVSSYQKIAAESSAPRDVRAKALLHLAGCYEKLGQQQSRRVYEQILRDFADQPEASQARTRLAALKQPSGSYAPDTVTQRKIDPMGRDLGSFQDDSTDGHHLVYLDNVTGELIFSDLAGKRKRVIYKGNPDDEPRWFPSRDLSMVALLLSAHKPDQQQTVAIVKTDGASYREIAKLDPDPYYYHVSWSWNNRFLLVDGFPKAPGRLMRISVADGKVRDLLNLKTYVAWAEYSSDGRFIAYRSPGRQICVVSSEGGEPQRVYQESYANEASRTPILFDWTADGHFLVVGSDTSGKRALELLPVNDGHSNGPPIFLRYGDFEFAHTTKSGDLIYLTLRPGGDWLVHVASLEPGHVGEWKRLNLPLGNDSSPWVRFSTDGNQIVYVAGNEDVGQAGVSVVRLRSLSSGEDREIYRGRQLDSCIWTAQDTKLFCVEQNGEKAQVFSISIDSGQIAQLHTFSGHSVSILSSSPDGGALFMFIGNRAPVGNSLVRWEIASGKETIVEQNLSGGSVPWASPDERWLVWPRGQGFDIRARSGGDWKSLVSLNSGGFIPKSTMGVEMGNGCFALTNDGNWLIYLDVDGERKHSLFRVSLAGGKPERLGDFPTESLDGLITISPDARKIISEAWDGRNGYELWSLENFVPPAAKKKE